MIGDVDSSIELKVIPHQGCVISRTADGIDITGSAMNWVMSAGVAPCPGAT